MKLKTINTQRRKEELGRTIERNQTEIRSVVEQLRTTEKTFKSAINKFKILKERLQKMKIELLGAKAEALAQRALYKQLRAKRDKLDIELVRWKAEIKGVEIIERRRAEKIDQQIFNVKRPRKIKSVEPTNLQ